jgi:16S rRNA (cytosine967-C5)-methyltransferase
VVDFCAGGGGKTLALAQDMAAEGRLIACDVEASRIEAIRPRLARAGLSADLRVLGADGEGVEDLRDEGRPGVRGRALLGFGHLAAAAGDRPGG